MNEDENPPAPPAAGFDLTDTRTSPNELRMRAEVRRIAAEALAELADYQDGDDRPIAAIFNRQAAAHQNEVGAAELRAAYDRENPEN